MFGKIAFLTLLVSFVPGLAHAACSHANLTRCLDSVCGINVSSNPSARCQYCGTADAGVPPADGMRSVSAGTSTKYNLSAKELKSAPTDPGRRYVWATSKCMALVGADCTPDDVSDAYDKLIEQSCIATGISVQVANIHANGSKVKTQSACSSEISACVLAETRCASGFVACDSNSDFDKFFSECSVNATGCDDYLGKIRTTLLSSRENAAKNSESVINSIVKSHADDRARRIASTRATCTDNSGRESCIDRVCGERMPNNCGDGFADELSMAKQLCKFYDTACATLK